ncbi:MAG TPA: hypothetical protein VJV79_03415 [Polyangiaceae bacterium]|nr:hypothetical protein [Polyangiaceae bacterium]
MCAPRGARRRKDCACGGAPFGVWRLTKLELGRTELQISVAGTPRGSCDVMLDTPDKTPRVLMNLKDGGGAEYDADTVPIQAHWSNSCVTSKSTPLSCCSDAWTGVSNCAVSCDICSCNSTLGKSAGGDTGWGTHLHDPDGRAVREQRRVRLLRAGPQADALQLRNVARARAGVYARHAYRV